MQDTTYGKSGRAAGGGAGGVAGGVAGGAAGGIMEKFIEKFSIFFIFYVEKFSIFFHFLMFFPFFLRLVARDASRERRKNVVKNVFGRARRLARTS